MKKLSSYLIILFIASCGSPERINYNNCLEIEIGMEVDSVIKIMGSPDTILKTSNKEVYTMYYKPPLLASAGIDIIISEKTEKVIQIICSE
jgi:hypothetical protein